MSFLYKRNLSGIEKIQNAKITKDLKITLKKVVFVCLFQTVELKFSEDIVAKCRDDFFVPSLVDCNTFSLFLTFSVP